MLSPNTRAPTPTRTTAAMSPENEDAASALTATRRPSASAATATLATPTPPVLPSPSCPPTTAPAPHNPVGPTSIPGPPLAIVLFLLVSLCLPPRLLPSFPHRSPLASTHSRDQAPAALSTSTLKRFRFNQELDMVLLRAAMTAGAHVAQWGKTQELFEKALVMFVDSPLFRSLTGIARPSWKTLADRFKKLISDRRAADKGYSVASGIAEVHGEREQLFDDVIAQVDEKDEGERAEKEEKSSKEKKIQEAGEEMRNRALKRQRRHRQAGRSSTTPTGTSSGGESDAEVKLIAREMETRKLAEESRRRIDEERLALEKEREMREAVGQQKAEEREARRITVDERRTPVEEKRLEVDITTRAEDKEERFLALEERKALIGVLGVLTKKLEKGDSPSPEPRNRRKGYEAPGDASQAP